ncbi:YciI family protein [Streptomyces sp. NPDC002851]
MKYLLAVQGSQADYEAMSGKASAHSPAWSEQELQEMYAFMGRVNDDLAASGELVDGNGLTSPAQARTVTRDENGEFVVADAPYGETEVVLAGYWVVDCASQERVTEIAKRVAQCPIPHGTPDYPVVIRPIEA